MLADVSLVANHLVVFRDTLRADLHAGVGVLAVAEQLELDLQLKVAVALGGAEELVARDGRLQTAADDGAVFEESSDYARFRGDLFIPSLFQGDPANSQIDASFSTTDWRRSSSTPEIL